MPPAPNIRKKASKKEGERKILFIPLFFLLLTKRPLAVRKNLKYYFQGTKRAYKRQVPYSKRDKIFIYIRHIMKI